jgi:pyroglutamyl-peptidase
LNPTSGPGSAVKSEYGYVRNYCKELWETYGNKIDFIIHLGMADGWEWYNLERSAWKQGTVKSIDEGNGRMSEPLEYYMPPDDIGNTFKDLPGPCPWDKTVPDQLWAIPGIDVDKIAQHTEQALNSKRDQKENQKVEVRPHPDAGNYICGFISYESFAQAFVHRYSAKAIFCHVPGWQDEKRLEIGRDFVCHLISQLAMQ